jgi:hypothetical protein
MRRALSLRYSKTNPGLCRTHERSSASSFTRVVPIAAQQAQELKRIRFLAHLEAENALHTRGIWQGVVEDPRRADASSVNVPRRSSAASSLLSLQEVSELRRGGDETGGQQRRQDNASPSKMRFALNELRRVAARHHDDQAKLAFKQQFRRSLATMLRQEAALRSLDPSKNSRAHGEAQKHQRVFQDAIQLLTPRHFLFATLGDLVEMLRACSFVGVDSSLAVASAMVMLRKHAVQLTIRELMTGIIAVATCITSLSSHEKTEFIFEMLQQATARLEPVGSSTPEGGVAAAPLSQRDVVLCVKVVKLAIQQPPRSIDPGDGASVFPYDLSKRFVEQFMACLLDTAVVPSSSSSKQSLVMSLKGWQLPVLCTAVVFFSIPIQVASRFLQPISALALVTCKEMTGAQLSHVLLAYASVGYRNMEFFVKIGQCIGDLGETVHEDDVARALRALALVGIEHELLRNSLESSLRMRSLRRKPLFGRSS